MLEAARETPVSVVWDAMSKDLRPLIAALESALPPTR